MNHACSLVTMGNYVDMLEGFILQSAQLMLTHRDSKPGNALKSRERTMILSAPFAHPCQVQLYLVTIDNGDRLSGERERHVLGAYVFDNGSGLSDGSERVLGDYVYDNGSVLSGGTERSAEAGRWLSIFFLFHMIGSTDPASERRGGRSRVARHQCPSGPFSRRHYIWGERLLQDDDEEVEDDNNEEEQELEEGEEDHNEIDLNILSDIGEDVRANPRRRRRLMRSRSDQDQS